MNIAKDMQELYVKKYRTLQRGTEENLNKWKDELY